PAPRGDRGQSCPPQHSGGRWHTMGRLGGMTPGSPSDQPLIRIRGVGRYFGPAVELHTTDATAAWHTSLRILGFNPKPKPRNGIQRPIPIAGQVLEDINLDIEKGAIVCLE